MEGVVLLGGAAMGVRYSERPAARGPEQHRVVQIFRAFVVDSRSKRFAICICGRGSKRFTRAAPPREDRFCPPRFSVEELPSSTILDRGKVVCPQGSKIRQHPSFQKVRPEQAVQDPAAPQLPEGQGPRSGSTPVSRKIRQHPSFQKDADQRRNKIQRLSSVEEQGAAALLQEEELQRGRQGAAALLQGEELQRGRQRGAALLQEEELQRGRRE